MSDWAIHLVDVALVVLLAEAAWLIHSHRSGRPAPQPADWGLHMLSGACLMVALRLALAQAAWPWWTAALSAAGAAHAADLVWRLRRVRPS